MRINSLANIAVNTSNVNMRRLKEVLPKIGLSSAPCKLVSFLYVDMCFAK